MRLESCNRPGLVSLWLACWVLMAPVSAWAAEVTARLDRSVIVEGETVTLAIQTDDPAQSLEADLSVLDESFLLLDRRSETQMSILNGRQTAVVRLLLTLEPKRSGTLQVPPLQFPGATTKPLVLEVEPAPELAPGEMPPVFIELALEPSDGPYYVHAQLSLTVKIFYQQNLTEASINPPAPEQASVRLLDEVPYPAERNGVGYRVLQRNYAIFPERSGTLVIPALRLTGRLIERAGSRLWQPSVRGRRVTEDSEPLTVEILPRPAESRGDHWLPARELTLSQQLTAPDAVRVGEPVTRTVIIDAVGLEDNMLEEPQWTDLGKARIYPDQPQGISRDDGQWVRGHKEFRYAVVPEQPGTLVLPELRLEWWDTVEDRPRTAVLPALEVEVQASQLPPRHSEGETDAGVPVSGASAGPPRETTGGFWKGVSLTLALLWIATSWLLFRRWREPRAEGPARPLQPPGEAELLKALKGACGRGDIGEVRSRLRCWLGRHGPAHAQGSIRQFAELAGPGELRSELERFDGHGYSAEAGGPWDGAALWRAFSDWRRMSAGEPSGRDAPPDLYARRD